MRKKASNIPPQNTARFPRGWLADHFPGVFLGKPRLSQDFYGVVQMERHTPERPFHLLVAIDARKNSELYGPMGGLETLEWKMRHLQEHISKTYAGAPLEMTTVINTGDGIEVSGPTPDLLDFVKFVEEINNKREGHLPMAGYRGQSRVVDMLSAAKRHRRDYGLRSFDAAIVSMDHIDTRPDPNMASRADTLSNLKEAGRDFGAPIFPMLQIGDGFVENNDLTQNMKIIMDASGANGYPVHYQGGKLRFIDKTPQPQMSAIPIEWPSGAQMKRVGMRGAILGLLAALYVGGKAYLNKEEPEFIGPEPETVQEELTRTGTVELSGDDERFRFLKSSNSLTDEFKGGLDEEVIEVLRQNPQDIVVTGHADPDGYVGNMVLSGDRAYSVSDYIALNVPEGVDITEVACGDRYPLFDDVTGEVLADRSRRIEVSYKHEDYVLPEHCQYVTRSLN